tara:strand:- start:1245 stop:2261 length:1017 start_codon:yes stop_codon:yes gene_type:complete
MSDQEKQVVLDHLQQSEHFVEVKFLPNFQQDHDNSLLYGTAVYKGMIVSLKPEYNITDTDVLWLHPNNAQCRALFDGGHYQKVDDLPAMNASAGVYQTRNINALGDTVNNLYTIVDTHLVQAWTGTVQSVYSNKYQSEVLEQCKDIAHDLGSGDLVSVHYTNVLLKGTGIFHYYNGAYKDEGLVLHSPLIGYTKVSAKDHPSDWIDESNHLTDLSMDQYDSIYSKCDWNSCELVNTFALKKCLQPVHTVQFQPINVSLSNTPIHNKLSPQQLVSMTPPPCNIPPFVEVYDHVRENKIKLPYSTELILKLLELRDDHDILHMYNNGDLLLPRHIIEKIA